MNQIIDISTYELYVIDYIEGRLSEKMRASFEVFLLTHPDIAQEIDELADLEPLQQSDTAFDKERLKIQVEAVGSVDADNYEASFAAFADGLLDEGQKTSVLEFVNANPALEKDFRLYKKSVLGPDTSIIYPDKSQLKQAIPLWSSPQKVLLRVAAALVFLLGAVSVWNMVDTSTRLYDQRESRIGFSSFDPVETVVEPRQSKTSEKLSDAVAASNSSDQSRDQSSDLSGIQNTRENTVRNTALLAVLPAVNLLELSNPSEKLPERDLASYTPVVSVWHTAPEEPQALYASNDRATELTVTQYLAKAFLDLQPEKTTTTTNLVKEGLKKAIDSREAFAIQSQIEDKKKTFEFLAGNFEFRKVNYD